MCYDYYSWKDKNITNVDEDRVVEVNKPIKMLMAKMN